MSPPSPENPPRAAREGGRAHAAGYRITTRRAAPVASRAGCGQSGQRGRGRALCAERGGRQHGQVWQLGHHPSQWRGVAHTLSRAGSGRPAGSERAALIQHVRALRAPHCIGHVALSLLSLLPCRSARTSASVRGLPARHLQTLLVTTARRCVHLLLPRCSQVTWPTADHHLV